jgi:hypothetical protein
LDLVPNQVIVINTVSELGLKTNENPPKTIHPSSLFILYMLSLVTQGDNMIPETTNLQDPSWKVIYQSFFIKETKKAIKL